MRLIIDSNQLQSEALRAYLAKSKSNFAVLTEEIRAREELLLI